MTVPTDAAPEVPFQLRAPLEFRQAPSTHRFKPWTTSPVSAVEVHRANARIGWLWFSDADRAAGWVTDATQAGGASDEIRAVTAAWDALAHSGAAPSAIRQESLGLGDTTIAWDDLLESTLVALWDAAGHVHEELPPVGDLALEALSGGRVSGPALDLGLRGQVPISSAMQEQIDALDSALRIKPTPEPLVVARATSLAAWSGEPEALEGEMLIERTYFATSLSDITDPQTTAVVHLRVPAGVPALFTPPQEEGGPGILLLARGITWRVDKVERAPQGHWLVKAAVEAVGETAVS